METRNPVKCPCDHPELEKKHLLTTLHTSHSASGQESASQCRRHKRCRFNPWVKKIPRRRTWQPTPVSCLEKPKDRGAWQATVHGVAKSLTQLKRLNTQQRRRTEHWTSHQKTSMIWSTTAYDSSGIRKMICLCVSHVA